MLGGTLLHAARRVHREQEIIQRAHAFGRGLLALQPLTQRGKRCDGAGTQLVELVQLRLCGLIDRNAVAVRMLDPVALPRRTMYLPGDRVVLEPVDLVPRKPGQTGLEAAEQLPASEIRAHALERADDERHRRPRQQIRLVREEHRDIVPPHRHGERGAVRPDVACRDDEITVMRPLVAHFSANVRRRVLAFIERRGRFIQPDARGVLMCLTDRQKRLVRHGGETCRPRHFSRAEVDELGSAAASLRHARQRAQRPAAGHEYIGQLDIAGNGGGERYAGREHHLDDGELLRRVAEEAVQIDLRPVEHMAFRQTVAQMRQPVARIGQRFLAQAVILGQYLRQIAQLGAERRVLIERALLGRTEQHFRLDHAAFALVDERERLAQQLGLVGKSAPRGQSDLHAARRLLQGQKLTCRREHLLCEAADYREHAVRKARKRQHLRRTRAVVVRCRREPPFHLMRIQLGDE